MAENLFISFELGEDYKRSGVKLHMVNTAHITQIGVAEDIKLCLTDGSFLHVPITEFNCDLLGIRYPGE